MDEVTVLRSGLVLERNGAVVLLFKAAAQPNWSIVLCVWISSPAHPFVTWAYDEITGACHTGHYFNDLAAAMKDYEERI